MATSTSRKGTDLKMIAPSRYEIKLFRGGIGPEIQSEREELRAKAELAHTTREGSFKITKKQVRAAQMLEPVEIRLSKLRDSAKQRKCQK